jgi:hypothetical protein
MMDDALLARLRIREVIEAWAICRDSGDWDGLAECWHPGAIMNATWFQGTSDLFIARAKDSFSRAGMSSHIQGGSLIRVAGQRAIAQTRVTISSRDPIEGVMCDIPCIARFYDFFECRQGKWALVMRQPIYEKDRADPVESGVVLKLDPALLARFPVGYRHLAYAQSQRGLPVKTDMPGLRGPEVERLYAQGADWLAGTPMEFAA